jgi:hypothetical protein
MHKITTEVKPVNIDEDGIKVKGEEFIVTVSEISEGEFSDGKSVVQGNRVVFNPPVVIEGFKEAGSNEFSYKWDFGMTLHCKDEWGGAYGCKPDADWKEKMKANIEYDLYHAFFHISMDPNYGPVHYALLGCLCLPGTGDGNAQQPWQGRSKKIYSDGKEETIAWIP